MPKIDSSFLNEIVNIFKDVSAIVGNNKLLKPAAKEKLSYNLDLLVGMFQINGFSIAADFTEKIIELLLLNKSISEKQYTQISDLFSELNFVFWDKLENNIDVLSDEELKIVFDSYENIFSDSVSDTKKTNPTPSSTKTNKKSQPASTGRKSTADKKSQPASTGRKSTADKKSKPASSGKQTSSDKKNEVSEKEKELSKKTSAKSNKTSSQSVKAKRNADDISKELKETTSEFQEVSSEFQSLPSDTKKILSEGQTELTENTNLESDENSPSNYGYSVDEEEYDDVTIFDDNGADADLTDDADSNVPDVVPLDEDILPVFIEEVEEAIQVIEKELLNLESEPDNVDILNEVFRNMHSLKGNSGLVGVESINSLAHRSENILDKIRKNQMSLNENIIDVLLDCNDVFKLVLDKLKIEPVNPIIDVSKLIKILDSINEGKGIPILETMPDTKEKQTEKNESFTKEKIAKDDKVENEQDSHSKKTNKFNNKTEQSEIIAKSKPAAKINTELQSVSAQDKTPGVQTQKKKSVKSANIRVDILKLDNVMNLIGEIVIDKIRLNQKVKKLTSLSDLISDTIQVLEGDSETDINDNFKIFLDDRIAEIKIDFSIDYNEYKNYREEIETLTSIINELQKGHIDFSESSKSYDIQNIKDELKRINRFFKDSTQELNFLVEHLSHIASELQEGIMQMRMVPISQLFDKIPRMVRTLSKDLNKKVIIKMTGEETELDKTVIEQLSEPLLHIIRNSLDHGIECPDERIKSGKKPDGILSVKAEHKGNQIEVIIEDDGKGIDESVIIKKAIEKGIITKDRAALMQSNEIIELIFKPGFSSAETVSEVSGRGVGMDVVLSNIKKLKGTVEVESTLGEGTKLSIRLPLTMAIMQVQLVKCENQIFAVPINFIDEIIKVNYSEIKSIGPKKTFDLRGEIVSIVDLSDILDIPQNYDKSKESCNIIIIKLSEKSIGFIVDKILGQQEIVIKKLGTILKNIEHVSGATILGEGNVILILDILGIYASAKKITRTAINSKTRNQKSFKSPVDNIKSKSANKSILIVDDAKTIRASLSSILKKSGFSVEEASDGEEALSLALSKKFDLFTVDVMMPRMNGYDFVKNIRNTPEYVRTPVIMISSKSEQIDKMRGIDAGADDYLTKPFNKNLLLTTINKLLS